MHPVGQTIQLWRTKRGLTQVAVAERCGMSRPNLSAIENGSRDLTLQTLRRIASTLGVSPGTLVDGIGLKPAEPITKLNRYSLDRIARLTAGQSLRASEAERRIAKALSSIMKSKTRKPLEKQASNRVRSENSAILSLKVEIGPAVLRHLIRRVEKNLTSRHE